MGAPLAMNAAVCAGIAPRSGGDFPSYGAVSLRSNHAVRYPFFACDNWARIAKANPALTVCRRGKALRCADLGKTFSHGYSSNQADYPVDRKWPIEAQVSPKRLKPLDWLHIRRKW